MNAKFLTIQETARRFRIADQTVIDWIKSGKIKGAKLGHVWRVDVSSIEGLFKFHSTTKQKEATPNLVNA